MADRDTGSEVEHAHAEALRKRVATALELRDSGREDWLDVACADRPELRAEIGALVGRAAALPDLLVNGAANDPLVGRVLDQRFRLAERVGAGAMGVVYRAEDLELRRRVACKVVRHGLMPPKQAFERFAREARSMAAVQHPAVAALHDRGRTEDDQVYLVMEFVDGTSLSDLLESAHRRTSESAGDSNAWIEERFGLARRGESSWLRTVVRWVAELAGGLEAVHQAGVLHRDVKPSNVRVRRDGRPALLDFGIALLDEGSTVTRAATSLGTPCYLPPEALERDGRRTAASDVYSLTATLYHLLTLRPPYEGTPTQVLAALATRDPVPATEIRPGLPRDLQAILDKGMHRRPTERFPSAAAFEADLRAFLEFRPVSARPVSKVERLARRIARSRAAMGAALAVVVVGVVAGAAIGARAWREHELGRRRARFAELSRHIPPNLGLLDAANRVQRFDSDRADIERLLDQAHEVAPEPLPTLLLRSVFRWDHGDARGAAQDMAEVAGFVDTPYARALAAQYSASATGIELDGLPQPVLPVERYIHAFHLVRAGRAGDALPILAEPGVRSIPHAEEMSLLATSFDGLSIPDRRGLALERYAELVRLEARMGGRTAMTAHIAGRLLSAQGRHQEALSAAEEGLALAPRSYVLMINAGYCALALHRLPEARQHLTAALELRPNYPKLVQDLIWVEIADERFDEAQRIVREADPRLDPRPPAWIDLWSATVATYAALAAHDRDDVPTKARELARAREHFARIPDRTHDEKGKVVNTAFRIAEALGESDAAALFPALADWARAEPENWWRRGLVVNHMPKTLDAAGASAVQRLLRSFGEGTPAAVRR
ncbi:MAG: protein kinase [Planctomycetes bacterium]|nr:protein kinase [Planctomycetota bacterium]